MTRILIISILQHIDDYDFMSPSDQICFVILITHCRTKTTQPHVATSLMQSQDMTSKVTVKVPKKQVLRAQGKEDQRCIQYVNSSSRIIYTYFGCFLDQIV